MTKETVISSGIIITDGNKFLIGHVTNSKHWSIPKGLIDDDETDIVAAVRETQEETDIIIDPIDLVRLGKFKYRTSKDLALFVYKTDTEYLPPTSMMKCESVVFVSDTEGFPEIDNYRYITFEEMESFLNKSMSELFNKINLKSLIERI